MKLCAPALLAAIAAIPAVAGAQSQTRATTQLTFASPVPVNTHGFSSWRAACPKQPVAGDAQAGTVHTARVSYVCYMDVDPNGDAFYAFRRSTDGGFTWEAAQTLFTVQSGESTRAAATRLVAYEHSVFLVLSSSRGNQNGGESIYVIGSDDQGRSWQGPLLVSTGVNPPGNLIDAEDPQAAAALGVLHVVFEADSSVATNENVFYTSVGFTNGTLGVVTPETRVDTANAQGAFDVDFPSIAADGAGVNVSWQDDRLQPGNGAANNVFSKTSLAAGTDLASIPEVNHTGFTAPVGFGTRRSRSAMALPHVYVTMEDSRNLTTDEVHIAISNDAGQSWRSARVDKTPSGFDVDDTAIAVEGSRVVVAYMDDRAGQGNSNNNVFVVVDQNAGADFRAGTHAEHQLTSTDSDLHGADLFGDVVAVQYEDCGFPEDVGIGYSVDGGTSWVSVPVTRGGLCRRNRRDVDEPSLCVTQLRDVVTIWISEPINAGNNSNKVFVGGTKLPVLQNLTAQGQGLRLAEASPADTGDLALVLMSITGTSWSALDPSRGYGLNLTFDVLSLGILGNIAPFLATIGPQGTASFSRIPDAAALLGVNVWAAAATWDTLAGRWTAATDPFAF